MFHRVLLVVFLLALLSTNESLETGTCFFGNGPDEKFERGESMPVCIVITDTDQVEHYAAFFPRVDEFTLLEIPVTDLSQDSCAVYDEDERAAGCYFHEDYIWMRGSNASLRLVVNGLDMLDTPVHLIADAGAEGKRYPGFWTALIRLDGGRVDVDRPVEWDKAGCQTCDSDFPECLDNFCTLSESQCHEVSGSCNLKVYVAWLGDDNQGDPLVSGGLVFSRFEKWDITGIWEKARAGASGLREDTE